MKWEYLIAYINNIDDVSSVEEQLNDIGMRGWELASIILISKFPEDVMKCFFKRPKK